MDKIFNFEQFFIIGILAILFLFFYDALAIAKIIYTLISRRRNARQGQILQSTTPLTNQSQQVPSQTVPSSTNTPHQNDAQVVNVNLTQPLRRSRGLIRFIIQILKRIFVYPFSLRHFASRWGSRIRIVFIKIPFALIWSIPVICINIGILYLLYYIVRSQFLAYPSYKTVYPEEGAYWDDYTRPIEIEFHIPIDQESLITNMSPGAKGHWEFERSFSFLPFSRRLKYYPEETIFPGQDIMIYLTDLTNHFHTMRGGEHLITFNSIYLPKILSSFPSHEEVDIRIDQDLTLHLNQSDGKYVEWEFELDKDIAYQIFRPFNDTVMLDFENKLNQGETYTVKIYQTPLSYKVSTNEVIKRGDKEEVKTISFTTVSAPLINSFSPEGTKVLADEIIKVVFDDEMDQQSVKEAFSISPETEGEISWEDGRTFVFTPNEPLQKGTHYEAIFTQGIVSLTGGVSEEDIILSFDTIGAVKVIGWSPGNGAKISSSINVAFDQGVDHASAQSKFSVSPNVSGTFSWSGNTMIFKPSTNLGYSTRYTVTIATGVKTIHGLDSRENFSYAFTTESNVFTLNVPLYRQAHPFGCNVAAIAMALSYKGAPSSEMSVYNGIAKDSTPCQKEGDTITYWGNPNVGYVGDLNGGGTCGGYGVHWGPASAYISSRGVSNQTRTGWNVAGLASEVEKGNVAVVWWQNGWASATWKTWNSPSGTVNALNGMHSEVVIGFIGPSSNPSHIITNDPWRGRRTLSVGTFNGLWGYFGRTAVVLY